jgi:hypothetical protein
LAKKKKKKKGKEKKKKGAGRNTGKRKILVVQGIRRGGHGPFFLNTGRNSWLFLLYN